jgi:hypothetical protein
VFGRINSVFRRIKLRVPEKKFRVPADRELELLRKSSARIAETDRKSKNCLLFSV